jgi:hypothetical protein
MYSSDSENFTEDKYPPNYLQVQEEKQAEAFNREMEVIEDVKNESKEIDQLKDRIIEIFFKILINQFKRIDLFENIIILLSIICCFLFVNLIIILIMYVKLFERMNLIINLE